MLGKEIKRLEKLQAQYQARLDSIHDADADPNVKAIYQSDMQYEIIKLDAAILHEKYMLPFRYLLVVFVVAVIGLLIYLI
jgi:hypothetical protein